MKAVDPLGLLDAVLERLPGSASRPGQREMVRRIAAALADEEHLLVQAGTGTGKTLGYLAPTVASRRTVLISTATKALQAQLVESDIPRVAGALRRLTGHHLTFALVKGRSNYLCLERVHGAPGQGELPADGLSASSRSQVSRLRAWAEEAVTGDRDEVGFAVADAAWRQVSVDSRDCLGARCPWREDCFAEKARDAADDADVVVANHALLALDTCTEAQVLPDRDVVVVDEAHELDRFVTEALTAELSATGVARGVRLAVPHVSEATQASLGQMLTDADGLLRGLPTGLLPVLPSEARVLLGSMQRVCEAARNALGAPGESPEASTERARHAMDELASTAGALLRAGEHAAVHVRRVAAAAPGQLRVSPLYVGDRLAERLLRRTPVVATSATITVDREFTHLARKLGFEPGGDDARPWSGVDVGSPFDYPRQAQLYVAGDLPPPTERAEWERAVDARVIDLVRASGGRCLALFSSRAAAGRAASAVRDATDLPVLLQGDDTDARLVWRFAGDPRTCLFATRGFWHGVDVPGSTCQLVIIDRLPFTYVDDPLLRARLERAGSSGFATVAVPEAAVALAQGVGRLIRSDSDRGVVAVLDPRLATAGYRTRLLSSLPPMYRTSDLQRVLRSLRAIDANAPDIRDPGPEPGARRHAAARKQDRLRSQPTRAQPSTGWTDVDDGLLKAGVDAGRPLHQLAERHATTTEEVARRIRQLGLRHPDVDPPELSGPEHPLDERRLQQENAYAPWLPEEDETLRREFAEGTATREIARRHGRNHGAIRARLKKLGLSDDGDASTAPA